MGAPGRLSLKISNERNCPTRAVSLFSVNNAQQDAPAPDLHLGRNRELDWLRAYAILLVLATHANMAEPYPTAWSGIVHVWFEGRTGVDLFFVISGLVISQSLVQTFDAARHRSTLDTFRCTIAFYIKRVVRLWPPAAFWAAALFCGSLLFPGLQAFPEPLVCFHKLVAALTYTFNWSEVGEPTKIGYFYSLATEMQFYAALPVLLFVVRSRRARAALAAIAILLGMIGCPGFGSCPQLRFGGIAAGILLFQLLPSGYGRALEPTILAEPTRAALFTLAALAALATCVLPLSSIPQQANQVAVLVACTLVGAAFFERGYVSAFGVPTLLDWIGSRSYSIYLSHIPVFLVSRATCFTYRSHDGMLVAAPLLREPALAIVLVAAIAGASELTFRFLERPFQRKAHGLAARYLAGADTRAPHAPSTVGPILGVAPAIPAAA